MVVRYDIDRDNGTMVESSCGDYIEYWHYEDLEKEYNRLDELSAEKDSIIENLEDEVDELRNEIEYLQGQLAEVDW